MPVDEDTHTAGDALRLFSAALRQARAKYGFESGQGNISQKQFAKMLGISGDRPEERYRLYEGAKREPPLWILPRRSYSRTSGWSSLGARTTATNRPRPTSQAGAATAPSRGVMTTRDQEEQDLRIDQMTINIEKLRSDMKWETRKFAVSAALATAAAVGAGVGIGNLIWAHREPRQPIVIQLPAPAK
jgi:DNA-binding transcriptional regulator YiaG